MIADLCFFKNEVRIAEEHGYRKAGSATFGFEELVPEVYR
jgi:hypothetical protein